MQHLYHFTHTCNTFYVKATRILFLLTVSLVGVSAPSLVIGQGAVKQASLSIEGEVKTPLVLTPADVDKLPKTTIVNKDRNEKEHKYEGVELGLILKNAGVSLGEELRGENLTKYLLVEASDGYQVVFSLPEIDPAFTSRKIILANRKDGALLSSDEGPFHIVIDGEKRRPRNARQVISIKVKFAN